MKNIKNKIYIKKIFGISLIGLFFLQASYIFLIEPTILNAAPATDSVIVSLTVDSGITITTPADVAMSPNIGISSDSSIGSVVWNVKTNNSAGYTLAVKASSSPALVSGANSFADYTEGVSGTPETWVVPSGSKEFGYSAYGTDTPTATWGTGSSCGTASTIATNNLKYVGFKTTDKVVTTRNSVTTTSGNNTTFCLAAEQDTIYAASGVYTATITATATTL